jgi:hypothetical protein
VDDPVHGHWPCPGTDSVKKRNSGVERVSISTAQLIAKLASVVVDMGASSGPPAALELPITQEFTDKKQNNRVQSNGATLRLKRTNARALRVGLGLGFTRRMVSATA